MSTVTQEEEYQLSSQSNSSAVEDGCPVQESPLPPADRGRAAYVALLCSVLLQIPVWGFQLAYGVFQNYETSRNDVSGNKEDIGVTGTTMTGLIYISMPFFSAFLTKYKSLRTHAAVLGAFIASVSLVISSFSNQVWNFIATQGILHALGAALLYSSSSLCLDTWFIQRKGLAFGTILGTKGAIGAATPFMLSGMLNSLGFRNTLRIWGAATFAIAIIPSIILRSRLPATTSRRPSSTEEEEQERRSRAIPWSFLRRRTFWIHQFANAIFATGYCLPLIYTPTYATRVLDLDSTLSSLMLAILAAPSMVASLSFGLLCDGKISFGGKKLSINSVTAISALGTSITVFFLWGFSANVAVLAVFSVTYGFFAGGFSSTWSGMMKDVETEAARNDEAVDTGLVFGLLNGGRGVGFIVGGLLGVELLKEGSVATRTWDWGSWGYESAFGAMIVFTGVSTLFGGWGLVWRGVGALLK